MKTLAKVVVGSRLHHTNNEQSDWDYRGIYIDNLKEALSPFQAHKTTSWVGVDTNLYRPISLHEILYVLQCPKIEELL